MSREDCVVRFDHSRGDFGSWINAVLQTNLLRVLRGDSLSEQGGEATSSSTTERIVNQKSFKAIAIFGQLLHLLHHRIDVETTDRVMASSVIICGIFVSCYHEVGVEEVFVGGILELLNDSLLQIHEESTWNDFSVSGVAEESFHVIIDFRVFHASIARDSMLEEEKLPASFADLNSSLANVQRQNFTLKILPNLNFFLEAFDKFETHHFLSID